MLVERKQRPVVTYILGVEDGHRTIVQDHPALVIPNGNDSVPRRLRVPVYDANVHYQQVRDNWAGVRTPDGR